MIEVLRRLWTRYFSDEQAVMLVLLGVVVILLFLLASRVLVPVLTALILAYLLQGLVVRLKYFSVPHLLAVSLTTLLLVLLMLIALLIILPLVWQQMAALFNELPQLIAALRRATHNLADQFGVTIREAQMDAWLGLLGNRIGEAGGKILSHSVTTLLNLAQLVVYLFLVPMLVFFLLKDSRLFLVSLARMLPRKRTLMNRIWRDMNRQMANYVRGKVIEILLVGAVSYVTFALFGLNYAALLALLVGISVLVPYVGAFAVTVPVLVIAYAQWGFGAELLYLGGAYLLIQILDGNLLVPLLFSEVVSLHPASIIIAVLFFGGLWGFWGIFFAIPLATLVKTIFIVWTRRTHLHDL